MDNNTTTFEIEPDVIGAKRVAVGGQDITQSITAAQVSFIAGLPPRITLELRAKVDPKVIEGLGVVIANQHASEIIPAFLASIDPELLERECLEREGWAKSPVAIAVDVLIEWAQGGLIDGQPAKT